ncbi:MAG: oligoendopeptidase F [Gammaproteobacteria bacterium]|nr:oligoendopeptidase F [Gammaproteobacteria bacterium]MDH3805404.1 oligoendopeptidase F [Gammaproteobacteria bacterium]
MRRILLVATALVAALPLSHTFAQEEATVDPRYTWDLTELFPTVEAWEEAREEVLAEFEAIEARRGTLGDSADSLYRTYRHVSDTLRKSYRVYVYASLNSDEDLRVSETQERVQLADIMFAQFNEATAWMQPELIEVGREVIESYIKEDERLAPFAYQLDDSLRNAPHTLGMEAEQTLSYLSQTFGAPSNTYSLIANSDIPWPTITLSDGEEVTVDAQGYGRARSSTNRDDRKLAFDTYWGKWREYRNSVGMVLNSHIQTQVGLAKARNYDSVLHRELHQDNLPAAVYHTLVEEVNKALPTLHRYFRLRGRMLGVEQMHYYDIYPPLVSLDKEFDIETSKQITLEAMSVLGEDWVEMQKAAMDERWMHVYPQRGKQSGAYMAGIAYDVHPYVLLNHNDNYASLSTLAHEWGHAMHTLYARQEQPFETAGYATFIAEIPSTSLELILQDYMQKNAETIDEKLFYLGHALEGMRGTFFRQTMFAEFELALYEAAERGEALSGDRISEIYGEILRRYHGHDEGIVIIDDLYTNEWMFIQHFYYNMYVFQYSTSKTAGTALYSKIVSEGEAGVENYKNLLRAGGSNYPYLLLVEAGVDLAKPEPYQAIIAKMNAIMDEMERLLDDPSIQLSAR